MQWTVRGSSIKGDWSYWKAEGTLAGDKVKDTLMSTMSTALPLQLSVAQPQSRVQISASAVGIETTSTSLVAVIDTKSVAQMPMNRRDFTQMIKLSPGMKPSVASVNGMRTNGKKFQIDGADNNDAY